MMVKLLGRLVIKWILTKKHNIKYDTNRKNIYFLIIRFVF